LFAPPLPHHARPLNPHVHFSRGTEFSAGENVDTKQFDALPVCDRAAVIIPLPTRVARSVVEVNVKAAGKEGSRKYMSAGPATHT